MKLADADILILPGLGNAGPGHWQRRWGQKFATAQFVEQAEWDRPEFEPWVATIDRQITLATRPVVLIAHSLAVIAAVHAAGRLADSKVRGAFFVSAPDLELNPDAPMEARIFAPIPARSALRFLDA